MVIAECSIYHAAGWLQHARIVPASGYQGWCLELVGRYKPFMVSRQRGGKCCYRSIDAAFAAARKVGFHRVLIEHSNLKFDRRTKA